ncbi:WD domain-containing protein [Hypoxylon fragiforme]|uniref:WD domain-containing protein n=1 Tax=Hypoxylon fragiforme TaxID=63214 RepID=UPI0020C64F5B|nr:WD domain-containing protein [Hypoxylon fragiforme]KAI2609777.1 WD domain-containing protein [Hypoxylon fragiforme]
MARIAPRTSVAPERLKTLIPSLKPTIYHDPGTNKTPNNIRTIAWNPLGNYIATGCLDKTLRVWNADKPNVRQSTELKGHTASIEKVAFNPVKELELCSVSSDGVVRFWDVKSKQVLNEIKGLGETFTLAWAPHGGCVVVGNKEDKLFVLSSKQSIPISTHQQPVQTNNITFCWSSERIFTTTGDGKTRILLFPSFEPAYQFDYKDEQDAELLLAGHTSSCIAVELHPFNRYLATGGTDSLIALWETTEWNCVRTATKMTGPVRSLSFSFDGLYIVGGSDEGAGMEIFNSETGEHLCTYKTMTPSSVVAWAPNRYAIAYADSGSLRVIGASTGGK